ncbi:hypothetical protein D3C81_812370 [compost metagenome]
MPIELVVRPLSGVCQAKALGGGWAKLDIARYVQRRLDLLLAGADGVFVEERANLCGVARFEVHLSQCGLEAHLDAPALRILAPGPAAVVGQQHGSAHVCAEHGGVKLEHDATAHHVRLPAVRGQVECPGQGLCLFLADIRRQVKVQLLVLALQGVAVGRIDLEGGVEAGPAPVGRPEVELCFHHRPTTACHGGQAILFVDADNPARCPAGL